jgi:hypothetical protein
MQPQRRAPGESGEQGEQNCSTAKTSHRYSFAGQVSAHIEITQTI